MKTTIKDIAKIAGVSHSTVSRSLNDSDLISRKTKDKIKKIAEEMGFEFNNNARSLSTRKTETVGVIFPDKFDEISSGMYVGKIIGKIRECLEKASYDIIADFPVNRYTNKNNAEKLISKGRVDGLLLADSWLGADRWEAIRKTKVPAILIHHRPNNFENADVDFICTDHVDGGYKATKHLIELGHTKIATITFLYDEVCFREFSDRTKGYKKAMIESGLPYENMIIKSDLSYEGAYKLVVDNKEVFENITGIFAQTDLMAMGMIRAFQDLGYNIPEDKSVIGYDDIEFCRFMVPQLTTIHQPAEEIAQEACERLLKKINGNAEGIFKRIIESTLVIRESTGPVKKQ